MTDFTWPLFEREPLDGNRAWSATFESYDQYHDVVYYALELVEGEGVTPSPAVTVKLGMEFAPDVDNWMTPDFVPALRAALEKHAAAEPRRSPFLELAELRNITTADAQLADGTRACGARRCCATMPRFAPRWRSCCRASFATRRTIPRSGGR